MVRAGRIACLTKLGWEVRVVSRVAAYLAFEWPAKHEHMEEKHPDPVHFVLK